jgi:hypothetical protein
MNRISSSPAERRAAAQAAVAELGGHRSKHLRLDVRCRRSHHVAAVYEADGQLVYTAVVGPHGHGGRDFVGTGHGADRQGRRYSDLLDIGDSPFDDDELPASCECGPRTLSRAALSDAIARYQRNMLVD